MFFAALDKSSEAERTAFLDSACAGDAELRRQVDKLLDAHPKVGDFLNTPALEQQAGAEEEDGLDFLEPSARPDALGRLGHYEVLEVLGQGGFGIVYRAFDDALQRVVAVKVLAPRLAATSPPRKRFLREARSSAQVRHENVVQVHAVEEKPLPYLVMEFIPGETLQQRLDRVGPLEVADMVRIGRQIAEGLAAAHANDLIHRDIKPANVLIETGPHERVKITDFGLARAADDASLTSSGVVAGTPQYMSPEQAKGEAFDQRADLFSLGSVLYVMATGRPPFRASTTLAVLKRVAEDEPRPIRALIPEMPEWLCAIVAKLHAKDPAARFQSARAVADLLAECEAKLKAHQEVNNILPSPAVQPQTARGKRKKWLAAAVVLLTILALAVTNFAGNPWFRAQPPTPEPKPPTPVANKQAPPLAIAPFDAAKAREHQEAWAQHLNVPVETKNTIGMKLILIPPAGVLVPHAYYLGKHEVTQGEWEPVMGYNPSTFGPKNARLAGLDTSLFPVDNVSWFDSVEFCNQLSEREGLKPYYELTVTKRQGPAIEEAEVKILGGSGYHLPTDAAWEHGCLAGAQTKYHCGDVDEDVVEYARLLENSDHRTHAVGGLKPNAFGLHDMHGNVAEWNEEMLTNSETGAPQRVARGGFFPYSAGYGAVSYRLRLGPAYRYNAYGLRVVRAP